MEGNRRGPLGNSPRDLGDDFIGEAADPCKGGEPPRWPPNPKKINAKKDSFHAKVSGDTAKHRSDRIPNTLYRRGHFMERKQ